RSSGSGGYTLTVNQSAASLPADNEPNNVIEDAIFIGEGAFKTGHLGYSNGPDNPIDNTH
ncbi:MAG: hypothetical protein KTR30_28835, partial [Saprospiraceae bacterium]|nr:hypothetical protein [Saprospiraceae bacterium]